MSIKQKKNNLKFKFKHYLQMFMVLSFTIILVVSAMFLLEKDLFIEKLLEDVLSKQINAEISMDEVSFSFSYINLKNFSIKDNKNLYELKSESLEINYNISSIFQSENRFEEVIDSLYIEKPYISFKKKFVGSSGSKKKEKDDDTSFDISKYLRKAYINQAELDISLAYKRYFNWEQHFTNSDLYFDNKRDFQAFGSVKVSDKPMELAVKFDQGNFSCLDVDAHAYSPDSIYVSQMNGLTFSVDGNVKYKNIDDGAGSTRSLLEFDCVLPHCFFSLYGMDIDLYNVEGQGTSDEVFLKPERAFYMQIPCEVEGRLLSLFKNEGIDVIAKVNDYQIHDKYSFLKGIVNAEVYITQGLTSPNVKGIFYSNKIGLTGIPLERVVGTLEYNKFINIQLKNAELDRNKITGNCQFKNDFVSADLLMKNKDDSHITLRGNYKVKGYLNGDNPFLKLGVYDFVIGYDDIVSLPLNGTMTLKDRLIFGVIDNDFMNISGTYDINKDIFKSHVDFINYSLKNSYDLFNKSEWLAFNPLLNGKIDLEIDKQNINSDIDIELTSFNDQIYIPVKTRFDYNFKKEIMKVNSQKIKGKFFNNSLNLFADIYVKEFKELNFDITINNNIILKSKNLFDTDKRSFYVKLDRLSSHEIKGYLPNLMSEMYPDGFISLEADYFYNTQKSKAKIICTGLNFMNFSGVGLSCYINGNRDTFNIDNLKIYDERNTILETNAVVDLSDKLKIYGNGSIKDFSFSNYQEFIPFLGELDLSIGYMYDMSKSSDEMYALRINGIGSDIRVNDLKFEDIYTNFVIKPRNIHFDNIMMRTEKRADINLYGDLSYDIIRNRLISSDKQLFVNSEIDVYQILSSILPDTVIEGDLKLSSEFVLGVENNQISISSGSIKSNNGYLELEKQPEKIENIKIDMKFINDRLDAGLFSCRMGDGVLNLFSKIENNNEDILIGNINIGQWYLNTTRKGIILNIPQYMPKDEKITVNIAGIKDKYATIKGDISNLDIDIKATCSNGSVIYPANTENIITLISTASKSTFKLFDKKSQKNNTISQHVKLPFDLDAKLVIGDRVKYVTYPTDITINEYSYLDVTYKNGEWNVPAASFESNQGTVDFLDTTFEVDNFSLFMNKYQFSVNGRFIKSVSDGTTVSLLLANNKESDKLSDNGSNLELSLVSDNPDDKTQAQIFNRLRMNSSTSSFAATNEDIYLRNETVLMIGSNLDDGIFGKYLQPFERFLRKRTYMDYFHIRPGFIKNMLYQYVVTENDNQNYQVERSEMEQFGSSILLNNLSVNFGRPIYGRFYFDYTGLFQEAIDMDRHSTMIYEQDLQVHYSLSYRTKISYTYKLIPRRDNEHEIMLTHRIYF